MISVLRAKFQLFLRKPLLMIGMTVMSIIFASMLGSTDYKNIHVPVYTDVSHIEETALWEKLNQSEAFKFIKVSEEEAKKMVSDGDVETSIKLEEDSYSLIVVTETPNIHLIDSYLQTVYADILIVDQLEKTVAHAPNVDKLALLDELKERENHPFFNVEIASFRGDEAVIIDNQLQTIFGFALFFVIYTISYNVHHILNEKNLGVWDRMILSPLKKWEMYAGNLLYSFLLGYLQVAIIFFIFQYGIQANFYGGFAKTLLILVPYVFSIVALAMFLVGVVKNIQQFNAVISLVAVSMSMIGGAYWPLEIVSSDFLLILSDFVPIKHAMAALKGATIYGDSLRELMLPMSIMTLMGVVLMGVGINIMERRT